MTRHDTSLEKHGLTHGEVGLILVNGELADENKIVPNEAWVKLYPFHYKFDVR
ncbi:hypothetical protein [Paenibacillus sp. 1_12]|uniref:hypothetical protein n=1 Tax=Paenibacillus sp. 1_12 TaxID=1566278 RepID=UPI001160A0F8